MGARLPPSHAAPSRREGAQGGHRLRRGPARRHRSHGPARHLHRGPRQLGERRAQQADAARHRKMGRHPSRRAPAGICRRDLRDPRRARGRGDQRGGARLRQAQGRALCHLLRELQQHRHRRRRPRGAGQERRRDRGRPSALLRHAEARAGRSRRRRCRGAPGDGGAAALGRQGLRRDCADAILRADAEVRMAADPAQGSRGRPAVAGDLRHLRIRRRHRQEGGSGARPADHRGRRQRPSGLPCAGAEHGRQGGRDAAAGAQDARRGDRALQRPWRHLGRAHRELRDGGEGRQARRPGRASRTTPASSPRNARWPPIT